MPYKDPETRRRFHRHYKRKLRRKGPRRTEFLCLGCGKTLAYALHYARSFCYRCYHSHYNATRRKGRND